MYHPSKFFMHGLLRRWQYAQVDNPGGEPFDKHKAAEVSVSRNQHTLPPGGYRKQFGIAGVSAPDLSHGKHVVPPRLEPAKRSCPDVLISKKSHAEPAR